MSRRQPAITCPATRWATARAGPAGSQRLRLRLRLRAVGAGICLIASGRLDAGTAHLLRRVVSALLTREQTTTLAIDLSAARFTDGAGVTTLTECRSDARRRRVRFTLVHPSPQACGYRTDRDHNAAVNLAIWAEERHAQVRDLPAGGPVTNARRGDGSGPRARADETSPDDAGTAPAPPRARRGRPRRALSHNSNES
jgi:anti-anti-sigma factor